MFTLKYLITEAPQSQSEINGKWVPSRPYEGPVIARLRDAWEVLCGRADAFTWPEGQ